MVKKPAKRQAREAARRKKLSTTIAPQSNEYLERLIASGAAQNVAQAIDLSIERLRRLDNRLRLERDTVASYNASSEQGAVEDAEWEAYSSSAAHSVNFDD